MTTRAAPRLHIPTAMAPNLRGLSQAAEAAARDGDVAAALRAFITAGDCAASVDRWRNAARSYRGALELDLLRREPVTRLLQLARHVGHEAEWRGYIRVLEEVPDWPHFGCRQARIVANDAGSIVECNGAGPVIELMMTRADLVEAHPLPRFAKMPLAMGLLIIRRALWIVPRHDTIKPAGLHVAFGGHSAVWLDERGDWEAL